MDGGFGDGELHALEGADGLAELLALVGVGNGFGEGTLGETEHLGGDADAAFVEDFDGDLGDKMVSGWVGGRWVRDVPCTPGLHRQ